MLCGNSLWRCQEIINCNLKLVYLRYNLSSHAAVIWCDLLCLYAVFRLTCLLTVWQHFKCIEMSHVSARRTPVLLPLAVIKSKTLTSGSFSFDPSHTVQQFCLHLNFSFRSTMQLRAWRQLFVSQCVAVRGAETFKMVRSSPWCWNIQTLLLFFSLWLLHGVQTWLVLSNSNSATKNSDLEPT